MIRFISTLIVLIVFSGCQPYTLHVHTEYVGCNNLASFHVNTPDPMLFNPPMGQRLMISWKVHKIYLTDPTAHFHVTIRFRNREEICFKIPLTKARGMYIYPLLNDAYYSTGGIRTYRVTLQGCNGVYQEWNHHLWIDLITFPEEDDCEEEEEE